MPAALSLPKGQSTETTYGNVPFVGHATERTRGVFISEQGIDFLGKV
jgi:hypothetical protein